ncbi:uncharacterized protein BJ171DRAFT_512905 [Polychytrium aggregatum]|uniref:uncharacterized protein n=1 Tax=Polychytrium aggregatum TaxID=110093 RepID=UPI0022FF0047|nr:uncharacterized protein BJ171DRAFT_512905 [Polychytrium aggregatum]KAI9202681.1 hypothetical protein BJ171DRAFT_512905 [Polychytrium aggregatum]
MTNLEFAIVDAFVPKKDLRFAGNPAAVVRFPQAQAGFPSDSALAAIAVEFNAPATCFLLPHPESTANVPSYHIRYVSPHYEIPLCGHGTLATSHLLFSELPASVHTIRLVTRSGQIVTSRRLGDQIEFEFPLFPVHDLADLKQQEHSTSVLQKAIPGFTAADIASLKTANGTDLLVELKDSVDLEALKVETSLLENLGFKRLTLTSARPSPALPVADFQSRVFYSTGEDPVCGVAHSPLGVYWQTRLSKSELVAYQSSGRQGRLDVIVDAAHSRIFLKGYGATVMTGTLSGAALASIL